MSAKRKAGDEAPKDRPAQKSPEGHLPDDISPTIDQVRNGEAVVPVTSGGEVNFQEDSATANAATSDAETAGNKKPTRETRASRKLRRRVVETATQLVSAQIVASSHTAVASRTVAAVKRIAAEYLMASARLKSDLEMLSSKPEVAEEAFVDRAYRHLMNAAEVAEISASELKPFDHPDHDALFEGAMFRAQHLLKSPAEDSTLIYAEQLFQADGILTENQVGKLFEGCEWPGLENHDYFYKFIVRVECWFHDHLRRLHFPEDDENFWADAELMKSVLEVGRRRQESHLFRRIYELMENHEPPNQPRGDWNSAEELSHAVWTQSIIDVSYCGYKRRGLRIVMRDDTRILSAA